MAAKVSVLLTRRSPDGVVCDDFVQVFKEQMVILCNV